MDPRSLSERPAFIKSRIPRYCSKLSSSASVKFENEEAPEMLITGLNEEELQQICGGSFEDEVFSKDDWI